MAIETPLNDPACLGKFTEVARNATARDEVQALADRFLAESDHYIDPALDAARAWLRNKAQKNDTGHGPEPRVSCGIVNQRVDYLGREPNCVERTILYTAIAELIDPDTIRQMATIKTSGGLHTFPVEGGRYPIVLDPAVTRNAMHAGLWAIRNGAGRPAMRPHEMVEWALELADEPAREHRNGVRRVDQAEQALAQMWRGELVGESPDDFRNSLSDIAWTFALAEQAARVSGGYGLDAVRIAAMAVQRMMESQARNWSFSLGGYNIGIDVAGIGKQVKKGAREVFRTAEQVAKKAGPLAGPALKAYLLQNGVPPQMADQFARTLQKRGLDLGPLGLQVPTPGSFDAIAFNQAVAQLAAKAQTKPKTKG